MAHLVSKGDAKYLKALAKAKSRYDKEHEALMNLVSKKGAFYEKISHKNLIKQPVIAAAPMHVEPLTPAMKHARVAHGMDVELAELGREIKAGEVKTKEAKALARMAKKEEAKEAKMGIALPVRGAMVAPRLAEAPEVGRPVDIVARKTPSKHKKEPELVSAAPAATPAKAPKYAAGESPLAKAWALVRAKPGLLIGEALKQVHGKSSK